LRHWTGIQTFTEVTKAVSDFREDLEGPMTCVTDNIVLSEVKLGYISHIFSQPSNIFTINWFYIPLKNEQMWNTSVLTFTFSIDTGKGNVALNS
jgi:hypothetical protein